MRVLQRSTLQTLDLWGGYVCLLAGVLPSMVALHTWAVVTVPYCSLACSHQVAVCYLGACMSSNMSDLPLSIISSASDHLAVQSHGSQYQLDSTDRTRSNQAGQFHSLSAQKSRLLKRSCR